MRTRLFLLFLLGTVASPAFADDKADQLIAAAKAASGGDSWDKLITWHERGKVTAGGLAGTYESRADLQSLSNAGTYALGPASGSAGWDGKVAWTTDSSKEVRVETSGEAVAQAVQGAYRNAFAFFTGRGDATRDYAGARKDGDKSYEAVKISLKNSEPFEIWLDPATHRIVREVQLTGSQTHAFLLEDWRRVGGVMVPFKTIDRIADNPKYDTVTQADSIEFGPAEPDSRYAPPSPPADDTHWPAGKDSVSLPFNLFNNHIYVDASINGKPARPFVFDTGATNIIEASAAKALGVKVEGTLPGQGFGDAIESFGLAKIKSVSLGGLTLSDQVFGSEDSPGWIAVEGADSSGLLGYEFAKRAVLTVDYAHHTLTFTKPSAFRPPAGATAIPFKFDEHTPMVEASLDGVAGEFEIDTGARGAVTLMHSFTDQNKLIDKYHPSHEATTGYGVGGPTKSLLARGGTLSIGPVSLKAPVAEFATDTKGAAAATHIAGNIGGDVLKRFTVTLDYGHQLMWLEPNKLAAEPEIFDRAGVLDRPRQGRLDRYCRRDRGQRRCGRRPRDRRRDRRRRWRAGPEAQAL